MTLVVVLGVVVAVTVSCVSIHVQTLPIKLLAWERTLLNMEEQEFGAEVVVGFVVVAGFDVVAGFAVVIWLELVTGFEVVARVEVVAGFELDTGFVVVTGFELVAGKFRFRRFSTVVNVVVTVAVSVSVSVSYCPSQNQEIKERLQTR